jgi:uncharacterized membrane protein
MSWNELFIDPILRNGGFNPANTLVLGLILVASIFLVYKLIIRLRVKIDATFFVAISPFIFWACSTRVLRDMFYSQALQSLSQYPGFLTDLGANLSAISGLAYSHIVSIIPIPPLASIQAFLISWFVTPSSGSYVITFALALGAFLLSLLIQRYTRIPYWKPMLIIGLALSIWNLLLIPLVTLHPLALILGMTLGWAGLLFLLHFIGNRFKITPLKRVFTRVNFSVISFHMLDASATFASLAFFGYSEQHVLPNILIPFLGPASMFLLKLLVLIPVLYIIDRETEPGNFRNFLKICIIILGLAPGLRDMLRLIPMV